MTLSYLMIVACPGAADEGDSTAASTGSTDDTGDSTTGGDCPVDEMPTSFYYSLSGPLPKSPANVAWTCTVDKISGDCAAWEITLDCNDGGEALTPALVLSLMLSPAAKALPFAPGMAVNLRFEEAMPFWIESALRIEDTNGGLLLAAARGSGALDPFSPQSVGPGKLLRTVTDICGTSRYYEVAIDLGGGAKGSLSPPSHGEFGAYAVWAVAEETLDISDECNDFPWAWEEVLVLHTGL